MKQLLSLLTSVGTITVMWLAGRKDWRAWVLGLANQVLWVTLIVVSGLWGLMPLSVAITFIYSKNLIAWRREAYGTNH